MIESKVKAASMAAAVSTFILWLLSAYAFKGEVPAPVAGLVAAVVPALLTFIAGYLAKHTHRPDARVEKQ